MKKYSVHIVQQVEKFLSVEIEAVNESQAWEKAVEKTNHATPDEWFNNVKDIDIDVEEVDETA